MAPRNRRPAKHQTTASSRCPPLNFPSRKALFITGYADTILSGNGVLGTGMEVMTKPFALTDLTSKIRIMVEND